MREMRFSRNPAAKQVADIIKEGEKRDAMRRAEKEHVPYFDSQIYPDKEALNLVSEEGARGAKLAVVKKEGNELQVVAYSTGSPNTKNEIGALKDKGFSVKLFITTMGTLEEIWNGYKKEESKERKKITSSVELSKDKIEKVRNKVKKIEDAKELFNNLSRDVGTSELLGYILGAALALRASDIHIEHPTSDEVLLRFRIDGTLRDITNLGKKPARLLASRVKLLAGLKLNITDAPQDGRYTIEGPNGDMEVRSSIVPAEFGEAIVMRVLDPATVGLSLSELGLSKEGERTIARDLKHPNGMILVTGPTGSGKTTTLYAFLKKVKTSAIKIITIEDPIEYHIEGVEQTQVDEEGDYRFASGLRSILRQDPDVILVGEIRDNETASVAIDAALTGHLVFSTLHTNNAAGAIPRLVDLGVKQTTIGPAIILVMAQRLVRRLCANCKKEIEIDEEAKNKIDKFIERLPKKVSREGIGAKLYEAVGCDKCDGGFLGRLAVTEILEIDDSMDSLIREKATEKDIQETAIKEQGMLLMQEDGILKALAGVTTIGEVERVTGPINW